MTLRFLLPLTATTLAGFAAVSFTETFEAPGGSFSADGNINLPSGNYSFDQSGWVVTSTTPGGVFYVEDPTSTQINTGSRAIALGGASTTGANSISITIPGFLDQTIGNLDYSRFSSGDQSKAFASASSIPSRRPCSTRLSLHEWGRRFGPLHAPERRHRCLHRPPDR